MKEGESQIAEESTTFGKGERVAEEGPRNADEAKGDVRHHHGIERIFRSNQAPVEESEGGRHHQHHCGGDQHPCGVCLTHGEGVYCFPFSSASCGQSTATEDYRLGALSGAAGSCGRIAL